MTTANPTKMTKKTIAGHAFELVAGRRYLASRPIAHQGMRTFDVKVQDITDGIAIDAPAVATVPGLSYEAANDLLAAFNDGESSFGGRVW